MGGAVAVNTSAVLAGVLMWFGLFGVAVGVLGVTALGHWWQRRHGQPPLDPLAPEPAWQVRSRRVSVQDFTRLLDGVDELSRQAVAAASAAARAEASASEAKLRSLARQQARELAWHEYDTAQRAYVSVLRTRAIDADLWPLPPRGRAWPVHLAQRPRIGPLRIGFGAPPVLVAGGARPGWTPSRPPGIPTPVEVAEPVAPVVPAAVQAALQAERREVQRAALAAYRRGDLTTEQLRAVYARFSGSDSGRERHEREVQRRRATEQAAHRAYLSAAAAERAAYQEADVAVVAAQALAEEAAESAEEARLARVYADDHVRRAGGRRLLHIRR
jgi:hypothetical protein